MTLAGHVTNMGNMTNAYKVLVEGLDGNRPLRRPRWRWEDKNNMDLKDVVFGGVE
jgi:hypothetical protein